jgi:adenylosuccinate synthase
MNKASIVVDLGFGDSGKGTIVDFLTRKYNSNLTVRFSGGPQCGHHVYDEAGNHHMFSQFGAGSLAGARTLLTKGMLINPLNLLKEEEKLSKLVDEPFNKLYIDENCVIITPYHRLANQILETSRGNNKHGSCGQGVWEALKDSLDNPARTLYASDLQGDIFTKLHEIKHRMIDVLIKNNLGYQNLINNINIFDLKNDYHKFLSNVAVLNSYGVHYLINKSINPIFEGNQGILLDGDNEKFYPYVTANSTTSKNALKLLKDCGWAGETEVVGVTRTYLTRHGVGPLPNEMKVLNDILYDKNNPFNQWQDNMRFGLLGVDSLRYAMEYDGNINSLAVTHFDEIDKIYQPGHFPDIGKKLGLKIKIKSFGPKSNEKEMI